MMSQPHPCGTHVSRAPARSWIFARFSTTAMLILLASSGTCVVAAESATITSEISKSSVQVAEPFTVQWSVVAPRGARVTFPEIGAQLGNFDVMDSSDQFDIPQAANPDQRRWTRRMTLETIFAGEQQIPEFEIQVRTDAGMKASEVIRTQSLTVRVASVLEERADPTEFRDIESVVDVEVPRDKSRSWPWWSIGSVGGLALLAAAGVLLVRRRARVTPENWALGELDDVGGSLSSGQTDADTAAFQTSDILRDFLLLQLSIPESGHTAHELVHEIETQHLVADETLARLNRLFTLADNAKFGGLQLADADVANAISEAREIVSTIATPQRR